MLSPPTTTGIIVSVSRTRYPSSHNSFQLIDQESKKDRLDWKRSVKDDQRMKIREIERGCLVRIYIGSCLLIQSIDILRTYLTSIINFLERVFWLLVLPFAIWIAIRWHLESVSRKSSL